MTLINIFIIISNFLFAFALGYYSILTLQWFSYKIKRVVFNFTKPWWHVVFFLLPVLLYYVLGKYFYIYFYFLYLPILFFWYKKLDKPLVFTSRVKRFFIFLFFILGLQDILLFPLINSFYGVIIPLVLALMIGNIFEILLFKGYKKHARKKLLRIKNLKIITITASFGKTTIKNFLFQILNTKFKSYKTPRSVNTLAGLIQDINTFLPNNCEIYITEAGARQKGDIEEIASFLNPQIAIAGEVGAQHIEYFKTI